MTTIHDITSKEAYMHFLTNISTLSETNYILWDISSGVNFIHQLGLVHGNLHGGNVLVVNEADIIEAKVSDAGL